MRPIYKITIMVLLAVMIAVLVLAGIIGWKYYSLTKLAGTATISYLKMLPDKDIELGQTADIRIGLETPWNIRPVSAKFVPGAGSQIPEKALIKNEKVRWGRASWEIVAGIQPFRTGEIKGGKFEIFFNSPLSSGEKNISGDLPSFECKELAVENVNELGIAGRLARPEKKFARNLLIAVLSLLAVAGIVAMIIRSRRKTLEASIRMPWETALLELAGLSMDVKKGNLPLVICVSKLTDIVRGYLEKRFSIRAPEQTTSEFLDSMKRSESPLSEQHKNFLGTFLQSADLVKFANFPPESGLLEGALLKAEELVKTTIPAEEEPEKGKE